MTDVANNLTDYLINANTAYNANNDAARDVPVIHGWTAVKVVAFRASSTDFAAQLLTDGDGHYRVAIRGTDTVFQGHWLSDDLRADRRLAIQRWDPQMKRKEEKRGQARIKDRHRISRPCPWASRAQQRPKNQ